MYSDLDTHQLRELKGISKLLHGILIIFIVIFMMIMFIIYNSYYLFSPYEDLLKSIKYETEVTNGYLRLFMKTYNISI
jgi:hypothetical protein